MKPTTKYTIVQFFEDIHEGYEYSYDSWPLHSTVIDTFEINWSVDEMIAKLTKTLQNLTAASSEAEDDKNFGKNEQVPVTLLNKSEGLVKIHFDVLSTLEEGKIKLEKPQYARGGFVPHATIQSHARFNRGDKMYFTALSVVDMLPSNIPYMRKVLKTIKIGI